MSAPHNDKVVYISADAERRAKLLQRQETLRLIREDLAVAAQLLGEIQEPGQGSVAHFGGMPRDLRVVSDRPRARVGSRDRPCGRRSSRDTLQARA